MTLHTRASSGAARGTVPPNPHLAFVCVLLQIYWAGHVHFYNRFEGPIWKGAIIANGTHNPAGTLHSCSGNGGPPPGGESACVGNQGGQRFCNNTPSYTRLTVLIAASLETSRLQFLFAPVAPPPSP